MSDSNDDAVMAEQNNDAVMAEQEAEPVPMAPAVAPEVTPDLAHGGAEGMAVDPQQGEIPAAQPAAAVPMAQGVAQDGNQQLLPNLTPQQLAAIFAAFSQNTNDNAPPDAQPRTPTYSAPTIQEMQQWTRTSGPMSYKPDILKDSVKHLTEKYGLPSKHEVLLQELIFVLRTTLLQSESIFRGKSHRFKTDSRLIDHPFLLGEALMIIRAYLPESWQQALDDAAPIQSETALKEAIKPLMIDRNPAMRIAQKMAQGVQAVTAFRQIERDFKRTAAGMVDEPDPTQYTLQTALERIRLLEVVNVQYQHLSIALLIQGRPREITHDLLEVVRRAPTATMNEWLPVMESILYDKPKKRKPTENADTPNKKGRPDAPESTQSPGRAQRKRPTTGPDNISGFTDGWRCSTCPHYHKGRQCIFSENTFDWARFRTRHPEGLK